MYNYEDYGSENTYEENAYDEVVYRKVDRPKKKRIRIIKRTSRRKKRTRIWLPKMF